MALARQLVRRLIANAVIVALAAVGLWLSAEGATAAPAPAKPTWASVQSCLIAGQASGQHMLTLREARQCAPGALELREGDTWAASAGAVIVTTAAGKIHMYFSEAKAGAGPANGGQSLVAALRPIGPIASCWNDWHWQVIYFSDGAIYGSTSGWGYGDHCGYANASYPSTGWQCANCSSVGLSQGSYDNYYGQANYGQNYAAGWANIYPYFFPFGSDSFFNRLYWDPWGNYWVQGW